MNPGVSILIRKDWKHEWNKKHQVKLKQIWYVLQSRGKEWLEICIENEYAKPALLQVFGNLNSFCTICSHASLCIENTHSFPGRITINVRNQLLSSHERLQPRVAIHSHFQVNNSAAHFFVVFLMPFHEFSTFLPATVSKGPCSKVFSRKWF